MILFTFRFALWSALLFGFIYFENNFILHTLYHLQTDAVVSIFKTWVMYFDIPVKLSGELVIFDHGLILAILDECNGLTPLLLYLAAVLAYPTLYKVKIPWVIGGTAILLTLNMLRIIFITIYVIDVPSCFECAHNIIGRYSIGISTLLIFYFFTLHVKACTKYGVFFNKKDCYADKPKDT